MVQKVLLQTLRSQFELMQIEKIERVSVYFLWTLALVNQIKYNVAQSSKMIHPLQSPSYGENSLNLDHTIQSTK